VHSPLENPPDLELDWDAEEVAGGATKVDVSVRGVYADAVVVPGGVYAGVLGFWVLGSRVLDEEVNSSTGATYAGADWEDVGATQTEEVGGDGGATNAADAKGHDEDEEVRETRIVVVIRTVSVT